MMRTPPLLKLLFPALLVALCLFAQPAWSITIDASVITNGTTQANVPGAQIDANGGTFVTSSFMGWDDFFGVQNGAVPTEIDILNDEYILITLRHAAGDRCDPARSALRSKAASMTRWTRWRRSSPGVRAPTVGSSRSSARAAPAGRDLSSMPINLSLANESGAGVWEIVNPFGEQRGHLPDVQRRRAAPGINPQDGGQNSDFALLSITTTPEPHTAALFGLGLAGLAILGRRQRG